MVRDGVQAIDEVFRRKPGLLVTEVVLPALVVNPGLAWASVFGTSVTLPPSPSQPIAKPGGPSGSTDGSLNAAYFGELGSK